ncbi:hypothetical protein GPJ56_004104 [Histomonas meleagridis]|uniref:uncharacterized protein n=1 Tax=Histomonas meleagridis TaxID=135588 RepID=UPI00355A3E74|nr:hypothetical protein GPJ56_004104 [Histomonas meleagridis]KAH0801445.1 hypothetical protein GO595_005697 [Histomonas meleagridis]
MSSEALFEIFDPSLNVHYENGKYLTFTSPVEISQQTKDGMRAIQDNACSVIIAPKKGANKVFQLRGGNEQQRFDMLKYVLSHTLDKKGKPLFDQKVLPFPLKYMKYMCYGITNSTTSDDLKNPEFSNLNIEKWSKIQPRKNLELADFTLPLTLDFIYASIILSLFASEEDNAKFDDLKRDEELDKKIIIELNIPIRLPVAVKRIPGYKYEFTFAKYNDYEAQEICDQIEKLIIPTLKKYSVLSVIYSNVDQAEKGPIKEKMSSLNNIDLVVVQDEPTFEEDLAKSYVIFISHDMSEEIKEKLKQISTEYFEIIRLCQCSRCHCFYSPTQSGEACITGAHEGHQIPFENGDMEVFDCNDETGEEEIYIKMSCCDEIPKKYMNDPDFCCKKINNGDHIEEQNPQAKSEIEFIDHIPDVTESIDNAPSE